MSEAYVSHDSRRTNLQHAFFLYIQYEPYVVLEGADSGEVKGASHLKLKYAGIDTLPFEDTFPNALPWVVVWG
jgi:hypothetical protein